MTTRQINETVIITNTPDYSSPKIAVHGPNNRQTETGRQIQITTANGNILMSLEAFEAASKWLLGAEPQYEQPTDDVIRDCILKSRKETNSEPLHAVQIDSKIGAIKMLRTRTGIMLKDAKDHVERVMSHLPVSPMKFRTRIITDVSGKPVHCLAMNSADLNPSNRAGIILGEFSDDTKTIAEGKICEYYFKSNLEYHSAVNQLRDIGIIHESA